MKYIYTTDEEAYKAMIKSGLHLASDRTDNKQFWIFEYEPELFYYTLPQNVVEKCCVNEKFTMCF